MRAIVTSGPTRQRIDSVRFITNASSGQMGYAVAGAAVAAGHDVTLLTGPVAIAPPDGCEVVRFESVDQLQAALDERFDACDALIMAAAVGDFHVEGPATEKIPRSGGPVTLTLTPTQDVVATVAARKRPGQIVITFAVEDAQRPAAETKARKELSAKNADFVVLNTPAAMGAADSDACILSADRVVLPWATRDKTALAREIVMLLETR